MRKMVFFFSFLCSCYKSHLYVQQEWVDREFLASSHVGTPDPRQKDPPSGQRLLIGWDFPRSWFQKDLTLQITVRLWDHTQEVFHLPVLHRRDYKSYYFSNAKTEPEKRILTYRIEVMDAAGTIVETWRHHFWTELIDVDKR